MKTHFLNSAFILVGALFLFSCSKDLSYNEAMDKNKKLDNPQLVEDASFLVEARSINMLEEELAELAVDTAYAASLVELAKKNSEDYQKLEEEIERLAQKKKIKLPDQLSSEHMKLYSEVNASSKEEFDKDLVKALRRITDENTEEFETMATKANDDDIRAFSARYLNLLREHSERIKAVEEQLLDTY